MMVKESLLKALNKQVQIEGQASFDYLAMGSWCEQQNMESCANFFYEQSQEETEHMLKMFHYINEVDGFAESPSIQAPQREFDSIVQVFESFLEHEQEVTKSIDALVELSRQEQDNATYGFLQWYVTEQREEEILAMTIIDRIKLIGDGPQSLYFIDKELESINNSNSRSE